MYKVIKSFAGSPDGRFTVHFHDGDIVELSASLAKIALAEKWVRQHKPRGRKPKQSIEQST